MYIAFYISSHGFGHMTRCLSVIEYILNNTKYKIYIACDKKQNDFCRIYLSKFKDRILYSDFLTDIGFVNKENSLEVDKDIVEQKLSDFISSWDDIVDRECNILKDLHIKYLICDISPIGCMVGNKLDLPIVFMSNFSWIEQYEHIKIDNTLIDKFKRAYSYIDKFIRYDLCLPNDINSKYTYDVGFVYREIDKSRVKEIKNKYRKSIFITCGKSANLESINVTNFNGTIFTTSGIDIVSNDSCNIVKLPMNILDTQNYIAASDLVIAKAGWGTIAEAVLGNTPLVLIERNSAIEDSFNIEKIKEYKLGISIKEDELNNIDIFKISKRIDDNIDCSKFSNFNNCNIDIMNILLEGDIDEESS